MGRRIRELMTVSLIVLTVQTTAMSQSLDCFSDMTAMDNKPVESADDARPVIVTFWSLYCPGCLRALPSMNRYAGEYPGLFFLWVNSYDDADATRAVADSMSNIRFVVDSDSVIWSEFNPTGWGVAFAYDHRGNLMWHGYTSEIDEILLKKIVAGERVVRTREKLGFEFRIDSKVGFGDYTTTVVPHDDGEEWLYENKPFRSVIGFLVREVYGKDAEVIELNPQAASTPIKMTARYYYEKGKQRATYRRALRMLCGGYGISIIEGNDRDSGSKRTVVIDYSNLDL